MGYPDTGGYMIAAYVIAAIVVVVYAVTLIHRIRKASGRPSGL